MGPPGPPGMAYQCNGGNMSNVVISYGGDNNNGNNNNGNNNNNNNGGPLQCVLQDSLWQSSPAPTSTCTSTAPTPALMRQCVQQSDSASVSAFPAAPASIISWLDSRGKQAPRNLGGVKLVGLCCSQ